MIFSVSPPLYASAVSSSTCPASRKVSISFSDAPSSHSSLENFQPKVMVPSTEPTGDVDDAADMATLRLVAATRCVRMPAGDGRTDGEADAIACIGK